MDHDLVSAVRLKVNEDPVSPSTTSMQDDKIQTSDNRNNQENNLTEMPALRLHNTSSAQVFACLSVGAEFYVWFYAAFFVLFPCIPLNSISQSLPPDLWTFSAAYYLGCITLAACILIAQIFIVVVQRVRMNRVINPSWIEFFPNIVQRNFQVNFAPDEAFERCIAVLNKTVHGYTASSFDIHANEIILKCLSRQLRISVRANKDSGSTVELEFVLREKQDFWHYYRVIDCGTREYYLSKFEREFAAMDSIPLNTFSKVRIARRPLNRTQFLTLFVGAISITSLLVPALWNRVQHTDLQNEFDYCLREIDWGTHAQLAVDEFTEVIDKANALHDQNMYANALMFRGVVELRRSHLNTARADLEQALTVTTDKHQPLLEAYLAETLLKQGHLNEAETLLQDLMEEGKKHPELADLGLIHYLNGLKEFKAENNHAAITHLLLSHNKEATQLLSTLLLGAKDDLSALHRVQAVSRLNQPAMARSNRPYESPISGIPFRLLAFLGVITLARHATNCCIRKANSKKNYNESIFISRRRICRG